MKKLFLLSIMFIFLLAGNSMAITWTYAGGVFDQQIFDYNNDWSPIDYPNLPPHTPSPGGADGNLFDFAGAKFGMDDNFLYYAVTSPFGAFGPSGELGSWWNGNFFEQGDFFFGFNGAGNTFGVDMTDGHIYANTAAPFTLPHIAHGYWQHPAIVAACGAYGIDTQNSLLLLGQALGSLHSETEHIPGDTWVLEMAFSKQIFENYGVDFGQVYNSHLHQTVSCGNDVIDECINVIPEPTTLALLGLGLLGSGIIARRKK